VTLSDAGFCFMKVSKAAALLSYVVVPPAARSTVAVSDLFAGPRIVSFWNEASG
jgi:hypothetical protein